MSPSDHERLRYGHIVLAPVFDGHGNTKNRPVVIVTPTAAIGSDRPLRAVCVSTQVEHPLPDDHVALPWSLPRHPRTGLNKPNVAKCNWVVSLPPSAVVEVKGWVPAKQMAEIIAILERVDREMNRL